MRKVDVKDIYDFKFVSAPSWSPEGDKAVFTVAQACEKNNNYQYDLYMLKDGEYCRLTSSHDVRSALWLDNDTLMFSSLRKAEDKEAVKKGEALTVFYSLDLNGGEAQECMRLPLKEASLQKLDNGTFACVAKYDFSGEDSPLCEVFEELPFWFNGEGYRSKIRRRLYLVKDGKAEPMTGEHESVSSCNVRGNDIIIVSHDFENYQGTDIGISLFKDGERKVLIPDGPAWNSHWAGFWGDIPVATLSDGKLHGRNQIAAMYALDGAEPRLLFDNEEVIGSGITGDSSLGSGKKIVCDGNDLYYVTVVDTYSVMRKFSGEGLETVLTATGSVDHIDVKNGKILATRVAEDKLPELYEVKNGSLVQITRFNEELFTGRLIAKPERLSVKSDGWDINGYVLRPTDYEEGKTYPAIMDIHGGPFAAFGTPYFHEMQVWAAKGYFVFYCNPRGGQGRGGEFGDLRGKYGTIDYDDLMAFCDKVLEEYPMIDKERLGVTGGSYGGFMTNWIIGHTDRFHAAAAQRSISNWVSFYLTCDIGPWFGNDQCAGDPWNDTEKLWWHSPLKYAKNVKTPTLFIHSDQDYRCWMAEGLQMFSSLKLNGVDTRMWLAHGESHELSRSGKPKNRVRRIEEITAWMDKYLK